MAEIKLPKEITINFNGATMKIEQTPNTGNLEFSLRIDPIDEAIDVEEEWCSCCDKMHSPNCVDYCRDAIYSVTEMKFSDLKRELSI